MMDKMPDGMPTQASPEAAGEGLEKRVHRRIIAEKGMRCFEAGPHLDKETQKFKGGEIAYWIGKGKDVQLYCEDCEQFLAEESAKKRGDYDSEEEKDNLLKMAQARKRDERFQDQLHG